MLYFWFWHVSNGVVNDNVVNVITFKRYYMV